MSLQSIKDAATAAYVSLAAKKVSATWVVVAFLVGVIVTVIL